TSPRTRRPALPPVRPAPAGRTVRTTPLKPASLVAPGPAADATSDAPAEHDTALLRPGAASVGWPLDDPRRRGRVGGRRTLWGRTLAASGAGDRGGVPRRQCARPGARGRDRRRRRGGRIAARAA